MRGDAKVVERASEPSNLRRLVVFAALVACRSTPPPAAGDAAAAPPPSSASPAPSLSIEARPRAELGLRSVARCELDFRAYELGSPGDGAPTAPVAVADGFLVAFLHRRPTELADASVFRGDLVTQRVDRHGVLQPPQIIRPGLRASATQIAAWGSAIRIFTVVDAGRYELIEIDGATGREAAGAARVTRSTWPDDFRLGPRGIVTTHQAQAHRVVLRDGSPEALLPPSSGMPIPSEQLLASGAEADVALFHANGSLGIGVLEAGPGAPERHAELVHPDSGSPPESSIAAGPSGFAAVYERDFSDVTLVRLDTHGALIGKPTTIVPGRVVRHPRVTALDEGWAVSYWDGQGPSVLRFDGDGRAVGSPREVRSGDERGGHTDARMVASGQALAVSWSVHQPEFSHGWAEEEPRRPGPRLGVFRCRARAGDASAER